MLKCDAYTGCGAAVLDGNTCYLKASFAGLITSGQSATKAALVRYVPPNPNYAAPVAATGGGCGKALPSNITANGASVQFGMTPSDGIPRTYLVHIPQYYDINKASPIIFAYHGNGASSGEIERQTGFNDAGLNPFAIAVYVQGVGSGNSGYESNPGYGSSATGSPNNQIRDRDFLKQLVLSMKDTFCIDSTRIFATGQSNGGGFCGVIACDPELSVTFAAIAPNSGAFYSGTLGGTVDPSVVITDTPVQIPCSPGRSNMPIFETHGTNDGTISYYGQGARGSPPRVVPTIPRWLNAWAERQRIPTKNYTTNLAPKVTLVQWADETGELGRLQHFRLEDWIHAWPDGKGDAPINVSPYIMDFFYRWTNPNRAKIYAPPDNSTTSSSSVTSSTTSSTRSSTLSSSTVSSAASSSSSPVASSSSSSLIASSSSSSLVVSSSSSILTRSSSSTAPSSSPTLVLDCPKSDNQLYTTPVYRKTYQVYCYQDYVSTGTNNSRTSAFNLQQCIEACEFDLGDQCWGVSWVQSGQPEQYCYYKSPGDIRIRQPAGAVVFSAGPPTNSSSNSSSSSVTSSTTSSSLTNSASSSRTSSTVGTSSSSSSSGTSSIAGTSSSSSGTSSIAGTSSSSSETSSTVGTSSSSAGTSATTGTSSSSGTSSRSATSVSSSSTAVNTNFPYSCPENNGQRVQYPNGETYIVGCGYNANNGITENRNGQTFNECLQYCSAASRPNSPNFGCTAVVWFNGVCQLKEGGNVDFTGTGNDKSLVALIDVRYYADNESRLIDLFVFHFDTLCFDIVFTNYVLFDSGIVLFGIATISLAIDVLFDTGIVHRGIDLLFCGIIVSHVVLCGVLHGDIFDTDIIHCDLEFIFCNLDIIFCDVFYCDIQFVICGIITSLVLHGDIIFYEFLHGDIFFRDLFSDTLFFDVAFSIFLFYGVLHIDDVVCDILLCYILFSGVVFSDVLFCDVSNLVGGVVFFDILCGDIVFWDLFLRFCDILFHNFLFCDVVFYDVLVIFDNIYSDIVFHNLFFRDSIFVFCGVLVLSDILCSDIVFGDLLLRYLTDIIFCGVLFGDFFHGDGNVKHVHFELVHIQLGHFELGYFFGDVFHSGIPDCDVFYCDVFHSDALFSDGFFFLGDILIGILPCDVFHSNVLLLAYFDIAQLDRLRINNTVF
ncbi:hypothetical protein Q7P36_001526 [Cladosporium allicinum]